MFKVPRESFKLYGAYCRNNLLLNTRLEQLPLKAKKWLYIRKKLSQSIRLNQANFTLACTCIPREFLRVNKGLKLCLKRRCFERVKENNS